MIAGQDFVAQLTAEEQALNGAEVGDELKRVIHERDLLDLRAAGLAARFAATNLYDEQGYASPIDWIRFNCHVTSVTAGDLIAVGENLQRMPETTQAMAQGEIGFAHVKAMARTANAVETRFDEAPLLEKARENSPGKFHHLCQHYRHAADAEKYAAEQAEQVQQRRLSLSTWTDGSVLISGILDPVGGAALRTALEPLARKSGAHDDRDREQRMADALVDVSMHALDSGLIPQQASQRTHLQVTTALETLMGLPGAPAAEMEFSLPVSSKTVERLACDASITRILLDSESMVIDVGRAKRVISGPTRKALNVRDGHCVWTGCERPASWTSGHHLVHWIHGGATDLPNLALLCYRHHWMVHEGNWQLVRGDDGQMPPSRRRLPSALPRAGRTNRHRRTGTLRMMVSPAADGHITVEARNLVKRYGVTRAVDGVSFQIRRGEIVGFLGANGAGKTTTLRMLCGLLTPTSGTALIDGIDIFAQPLQAKARLGYLDEEPFVHPHLTGREFLNYIADLYRMPRGPERQQRMERLLGLFELADRDGELIGAYSHGMRQKIGLASLLIREPSVLLLDEPTNGLDPRSARLVKDLLEELAALGTTVLLSTHILEVAQALCHRVAIIDRGHIVATGTIEELRAQAGSEQASLEDLFLKLTAGPESRELIERLLAPKQ